MYREKLKRGKRKQQKQATIARVQAALSQAAEVMTGHHRHKFAWGFLLGLSSLALGTYNPALAENGRSQDGEHRAARQPMNIPAGDLSSALTTWSRQAGVLLLHSSALIKGLQTQGVQGTYTPEEALRILLDGTGLEYRFSDANTAVLQAAATSGAATAEEKTPVIEAEPIVVEETRKQSKVFLPPVDGYKADETTGVTRTALPVTETPSSIGVVTRDIIKDTFSLRQQDAFEHVSGVSRSNTRVGRAEGFNIRGFIVGDFLGNQFGALRQNGLAADSSWALDPALVERYEIIKGPASIAGGSSQPGGFVNRITKRPQDTNFAMSQFQAGSFGLYRGVFDANGVLPQNTNVRGRFILAVEEGGNFVDNVDVRQYTIGPSVEMDLLGGAGNLLLTSTFQKFDGSSYPGFPFLENGEVPDIPRTRNFGGGSANGAETTFDGQNYEAHYVHQFVSNLTLSMRGKYANSDASEAAPYAYTRGGIPLSGDTYVGGVLRQNAHETFAGEVFLSKEFEAFEQKHEVLLGVDHRDHNQEVLLGGSAIGLPGTPEIGFSGNIFTQYNSPANTFNFQLLEPGAYRRTVDLLQTGVFGQVVARPFSGLTMVGAFRHDWAEVTNAEIAPGLFSRTRTGDNTAFTGRIGAIYELLSGVRVYGGYSESFRMNFFSPGADPTQLVDPETGQNYEVGAKLDLLDGRVLVTTALFRNLRQNVPTRNPVTRINELIGEQRHQGVEFDVNGQPMPGLNVTGNVSYVDAKVTKDHNSSRIGTPPIRTPRGYLGKVFATYELQTGVMQGLGFGGGVFFHSGFELDRGAFQTDPYERVDVIVFYRPPQKTYDFTINVRNLLDATYIENPGGRNGYNGFGAPATVVGTLRYTF